jgi:hypothetical protein
MMAMTSFMASVPSDSGAALRHSTIMTKPAPAAAGVGSFAQRIDSGRKN